LYGGLCRHTAVSVAPGRSGAAAPPTEPRGLYRLLITQMQNTQLKRLAHCLSAAAYVELIEYTGRLAAHSAVLPTQHGGDFFVRLSIEHVSQHLKFSPAERLR